MEYIYGKNAVESFLDSDVLVEVYLQEGFNDQKYLNKLNNHKIKLIFKDSKYLDKLSDNNKHQGVVAKIREFPYSSFEKILNKDDENALIVMLDGISDPHNFGAIIRTCEAFSVSGIIVSKHNSCPLNSTVAKVSTGTIANVDICEVNNLTNAIKTLKENGYWIYAAEAYNSTDYNTLDYKGKKVLVVGSEGFGISRLVKEQADFNIKIPMTGRVNSLNVSVATAILIAKMSIQ